MRRLRDALRARSIPVWTDENIVVGTPSWKIAIEEALESAFCVLVILSPDSKRSVWVRREIEWAQSHQLPIFPALWSGDPKDTVPFELGAVQFVDLRTDFAQGEGILGDEIAKAIQATPSAAPAAAQTASAPTMIRASEYRLDDNAWLMLLDRMAKGRCTPFLGASLHDEAMPSERKIARQFAEKFSIPTEHGDDLTEVAQFLALEFSPLYIKEMILDAWYSDVAAWRAGADASRFGLLADLNLPVYVTTLYDDMMLEALRQRGRQPTRVLYDTPSETVPVEASASQPIVYHLYGHYSTPDSVVMTEDDYLDYLVRVSKSPSGFPGVVLRRFTTTTLLFIGFTPTSWGFRTLYRILGDYLRQNQNNTHVAVQLAPSDHGFSETQVRRLNEFLKKYFGRLQTHIYIGTPDDFIQELKLRQNQGNSR